MCIKVFFKIKERMIVIDLLLDQGGPAGALPLNGRRDQEAHRWGQGRGQQDLAPYMGPEQAAAPVLVVPESKPPVQQVCVVYVRTI